MERNSRKELSISLLWFVSFVLAILVAPGAVVLVIVTPLPSFLRAGTGYSGRIGLRAIVV